MPISLSAKKSLRKALKNNKENVSFKKKLKSVVKKFLSSPTIEDLKSVYSILDKAVKKNIFHKNKVARLKSRYSKKLTKSETVVKTVKKTAKAKIATKKNNAKKKASK
jgi:small subunit ribosomal protein S20